ncbi:unnamed protein product, partial [Timema podura]|nr:unnamed protein product [Timema podura]
DNDIFENAEVSRFRTQRQIRSPLLLMEAATLALVSQPVARTLCFPPVWSWILGDVKYKLWIEVAVPLVESWDGLNVEKNEMNMVQETSRRNQTMDPLENDRSHVTSPTFWLSISNRHSIILLTGIIPNHHQRPTTITSTINPATNQCLKKSNTNTIKSNHQHLSMRLDTVMANNTSSRPGAMIATGPKTRYLIARAWLEEIKCVPRNLVIVF